MTQLIPASPPGSVLPHQGAREWLTRLSIDQTDPFFFDHPLDHVPGMLLVCAVADLAGDRCGVPEESRVRGVVNFRAPAGFSPGLLLRGDMAENGRRNLRITQESTVVADGWFEVSPEPEPEPASEPEPLLQATSPDRAGHGGPEPAGASLVHRVRSENVMLGEPSVTDGQVTAAVLLPPAGHALCGRQAGHRSVRAVIEAGRQLSTWLTHRVGGWPLDTQMLWLKLTADLPFGLPRSVPVTLRWQSATIPGDRARLSFDVIAGDGEAGGGGRKVGSLIYVSMGLSLDGGKGIQTSRSAA